VAAGLGDYVIQHSIPLSFASADSQSPGIYATAFYSHPAHAQVVWLTGLNAATDQPTYLDATTVITSQETSKPTPSANSPDRL